MAQPPSYFQGDSHALVTLSIWAEIIRGMENLRTALRLRMGHGPVTAEQVSSMAAALDAAAIAIERS
jgi:hypothetical protein